MFIKLIIIFSAAYIFNDLLLTVYCRFAEKIDRRKEIKRQKVYQTSNIGEATIENEKFTKYKLKSILGKTYTKWNPYIYGWMRYCIILVGRIPSTRIRNWKYRTIFNMKITKKTVIYGGCEIRSPWNIKADNCVISTYCILD